MKKQVIFSVLLAISNFAAGQSALTNQYYFNYLAINPAFAGENGSFALKGVLGNQFNGTFRPAQVSQIIVIDGQLNNNSAIAFQAFRSNQGSNITNGLNLNYAKTLTLNNLKLKFGVDAGLIILPNVLNSINNSFNTSAYFGVGTLAIFKPFYLGVSMPMVYSSKYIFEEKPLFSNFGYVFDNDNLVSLNANVVHSVYFKNNKQNLDFNLKAWINKRVAFGLSFISENQIFNTPSKKVLLPIIQYKFSKSVDLGLSYNGNRNSENPTTFNQGNGLGTFQVLFRYSNNDVSTETSILNNL